MYRVFVAEPRTRKAFIEKYYRLCFVIAREFVYGKGQHVKWSPSGAVIGNEHDRAKTDIEELASAALVSLSKCRNVKAIRYQKGYINRLIRNAIINEAKWNLQYYSSREHQAPEHAIPGGKGGRFDDRDNMDWFDTHPGRDGLAGHTQTKFDSQLIIQSFNVLTQAERIVIEYHFGLNSVEPIGEYAIACKMGRTRYWVQHKLNTGLAKLRQSAGVRAQ